MTLLNEVLSVLVYRKGRMRITIDVAEFGKYAIHDEHGMVLAKDLEWELDRGISRKLSSFFARTRYDSINEAREKVVEFLESIEAEGGVL